MFIPFLGFGIFLVVLRAASTQSAPQRIYPELGDEELPIDELANTIGRNIDPEEILEILSGRVGSADYTDSLKGIQTLHRKPKFGYGPRDPEFFMSPKQLQQGSMLDRLGNQDNVDLDDPKQMDDDVGIHPESRLLGQPPPHMKKSEQGSADDFDSDGPELEPVPHGGHIMTSSHAVDHSGAYATRLPDQSYSTLYIILVAGGSAMGVVMVVAAGICWYRINERVKATADVDYPAYGVTGPSKDVSPTGGDRKLAQSAHMYHYQHQKQQMAALQKSPLAADGQGSAGSDIESEDENEEGDYTVYECPGLAPAGDMEVKNPLYQDEPTPATPQTVKCEDEGSEASK